VETSSPSRATRAGRALGWLLAASLIAAGGAGIVSGADHPPGDATRPELTWSADVAFAGSLADVTARFEDLSGDVDALADTARLALVDLVARRDDLLGSDLARGSDLAGSIDGRVGTLRTAVAALPFADRPERLGTTSRLRLQQARTALDAVGPLPAGWRRLADGVLPAIGLAKVLSAHDDLTFAATRSGVQGQYADALASLKEAASELDQARATRDRLQPVADVTTLSAWIDRAAAYDAALQKLYAILRSSKGTLTAEARAAIADVDKAQKQLPPDTRALIVIMGDVAQGGLNQAAIAIEEARGDLATALAALH
jgi:hypothetical protein